MPRAIRVRAHDRNHKGRLQHVPAHTRIIGDAAPVVRQYRTGDTVTVDLFSDDMQQIQEIDRQIEGGILTGRLARVAWGLNK